MKRKRASSTVFIIAFFVAFLAFTAFAVDGTIIFVQRLKLQGATEAAAMAGASEFNFSTDTGVQDTRVRTSVQDTLNLMKEDSLQYLNVNNPANLTIDVDTTHKEVKVTTNYIAQPYFLAFLGVTGIRIQALACAKSEPLDVMSRYSDINWITSAGVYISNIVWKDTTLHDTAILTPLGNFLSASIDPASGWVMFQALDPGVAGPLSLGPGGFITIRLPAPIIDKPGNDLYIKEAGALEGYFVFAGLDNDTGEPGAGVGPYVNAEKTGAGISWIDISCSATPELADTSGENRLKPYSVSTKGLGNKTKFYGSAYYDLGNSCITNTANDISMAKYIRIVDDNSESAFLTTTQGNKSNTVFYKTMLFGEASTDTSGADIDSVRVLNHVRLKPPANYGVPNT